MTNRIFQPPVDVFRCDDSWYVKVELAGVKAREILIEAREDTLSISGIRKDTRLESSLFYQSLEIAYSRFNRQVRLPFPIDPGSIHWDYRDGMLLIEIARNTGSGPR